MASFYKDDSASPAGPLKQSSPTAHRKSGKAAGKISTGSGSESEGLWNGPESTNSNSSCGTPLTSTLRASTWSPAELRTALAFAGLQTSISMVSDSACSSPSGLAVTNNTRNTPRPAKDSSASQQPKLLKQINTYQTKEDLLDYISTCHASLDEINLVTCIYRLARIHCNIKNPASRQRWSDELLGNSTFQLLLRTIQSHLIQAQLKLMNNGKLRGFDARCISNLIWAIVKLELTTASAAYGNELVQNVSPLVLHFLPESSSQGLANLLWAYSKMSSPLLDVMMMIMSEMAIRLQNQDSHFDAQALSNSIWALAHIRSKVPDLDLMAGTAGLTGQFMHGIASCSLALLGALHSQPGLNSVEAYMLEAERRFSGQALVNICWSFASILGSDCGKIPAVKSLFDSIRTEALIRLQAASAALQLNQPPNPRLQGGFNEQALSNIVYAFDKAQLLDADVLQSVYNVAVQRLDRSSGQPVFKPQELCTLLRAAQSGIAQPWAFLSKLQSVLVSGPAMIQQWSVVERAELDRAMSLLEMFRTSVMLQQMQFEQQKQHALRAIQYAGQVKWPPPATVDDVHQLLQQVKL